MSAAMHLPSGLVTFLFTDIEGSTRLAQMLGARYRAVLAEHRAVLRARAGPPPAAPSCHRGRLAVLRVRRRGRRARRLRRGRSGRSPRTSGPTADGARGSGWACTPGSAEPYARRVRHARGAPGRADRGRRARRAGAVLGRDRPRADRRRRRRRSACADLGLHRLRGFDGRERLFQLVAPGLDRAVPASPRAAAAAAHNLPVAGDRLHRPRRRAARPARAARTPPAGHRGRARRRRQDPARGRARRRARRPATPTACGSPTSPRVADADLVEVCLADALGLRPEPGRPLADTLADHVAGRRLLLVLDTCDALPGRGRRAGRAAARRRRRRHACWPPAGSRSACPASWSGASRRWRCSGRGRQRPSDAVALLVDRAAAARGGRPVAPAEMADLARVAAAPGRPAAGPRTGRGPAAGALGRAAGRPAWTTCSAVDRRRRLRPASACRSPAPDHGRDRRLVVPHAAARTPPGCCAGCRCSPARSTWPRWRWCSAPTRSARSPTLVDKSLLQADGAGLPDAGPDPVVRRAAAGRGRRGAHRPQPARRLVPAGRPAGATSTPTASPVTLSLHALDPLADEVRAALRWTATGGSARAGLASPARSTSGGASAGWPGRAGAGCSGCTSGSTAAGEPVPDAELAAAYHVHSAAGRRRRRVRRGAGVLPAGRGGRLPGRRPGAAGAGARRPGRAAARRRPGRRGRAGLPRRDRAGPPGQGVAGDALFAVYTPGRAAVAARRPGRGGATCWRRPGRWRPARPAERGRRTVDMILGLVALDAGRPRRGARPPGGRAAVAGGERLPLAGRRDPQRDGRAVRARRRASDGGPAVRGGAGGPRPAAGLAPGCSGPYWAEHEAAVRGVLGDAVFDSAYAEGTALSVGEAAAVALRRRAPRPRRRIAPIHPRVNCWQRHLARPIRVFPCPWTSGPGGRRARGSAPSWPGHGPVGPPRWCGRSWWRCSPRCWSGWPARRAGSGSAGRTAGALPTDAEANAIARLALGGPVPEPDRREKILRADRETAGTCRAGCGSPCRSIRRRPPCRGSQGRAGAAVQRRVGGGQDVGRHRSGRVQQRPPAGRRPAGPSGSRGSSSWPTRASGGSPTGRPRRRGAAGDRAGRAVVGSGGRRCWVVCSAPSSACSSARRAVRRWRGQAGLRPAHARGSWPWPARGGAAGAGADAGPGGGRIRAAQPARRCRCGRRSPSRRCCRVTAIGALVPDSAPLITGAVEPLSPPEGERRVNGALRPDG